MTTPFTDFTRYKKKEQTDNQLASQLSPDVPWPASHLDQIVEYERLVDPHQAHSTVGIDSKRSSVFIDDLDSIPSQDSYIARPYSSTLHVHANSLGDSITGEWSAYNLQQMSDIHSQPLDPRIQHQELIQHDSDFQPHPNIEGSDRAFTHLSEVSSYPASYASSCHPLSPMPADILVIATPEATTSKIENDGIFRENIKSVSPSLQVQQCKSPHIFDIQPSSDFFSFPIQSPRSSISHDDACSIASNSNQPSIDENQHISEMSRTLPIGVHERQVGSLTAATSNLVLSTSCTSSSISIPPYSVAQMQVDIPSGTTSGQCIAVNGKRRASINKSDHFNQSGDDLPISDIKRAGSIHKKMANKRSRDRLNQAPSTSSVPQIPHQLPTLVPYAFTPLGSSDHHSHASSASSSSSVGPNATVFLGSPPRPSGIYHSSYNLQTSTIDLSMVKESAIISNEYTRLQTSQSQQTRVTSPQHHTTQTSPVHPSSYSTNISIALSSNAHADTLENVHSVLSGGALEDSTIPSVRNPDPFHDIPGYELNNRSPSQGYSSNTTSSPEKEHLCKRRHLPFQPLLSQSNLSHLSQPSTIHYPDQQNQHFPPHLRHQPPPSSLFLNIHQEEYLPPHPAQQQFYEYFFQQQQQQQQQQQHHREQLYFIQQQGLQQQLQHSQEQYSHLYSDQQQHQRQLPLFGSISSHLDLQDLGTQSEDEHTSSLTSSSEEFLTISRVRVPRTRARSRTLPTLGDLKDLAMEPSGQSQAIITTPNQAVIWQEAPAQLSSSPIIATAVPEVPISAKVEKPGSRSQSPSHEKDIEDFIDNSSMSDRESEVEEVAVKNTLKNSSSSPSTAAPIAISGVTSTRPARHPCPRCSKRFTRPFNLRSHILAHDNERPYACDGKQVTGERCNSRFARRHDLVRHFKAKHPDPAKVENR